MSETMTDQEAVDALLEAQREDGLEGSTDRQAREFAAATSEQVETPSPEDDVAEGTTSEEEDSFLQHLDPSSLPEELQPYYRSMQGDYTRSKQGLAERDRQYEALEEYGGVETATQALDWLASLQEPENALALHRELTTVLQEQGLTPAEANVEAARQVEQIQDDYEDEIGGVEPSELTELKSQMDELRSYMAEQEEAQFLSRVAADMDRQEAEIRNANPEFDDDDMESIFNLGYSTGANLNEAAELYKGIETHILSRWIDKKGTLPTPGELPAGGAADQAAEIPRDLYDPDLEKTVNRFIAESMAAEQ